MACNQGCEKACGHGQASGLGQVFSCGRNAARFKVLVDTIPQAQLVNNRQHTPDITLAQTRDAAGRHGLVEAVTLTFTKEYTLGAASAAVLGRELLQTIGNLFLEDVSGWQYFAGVDFRNIRDDFWMRMKRLYGPDPDALPANGNATVSRDFRITIPLTRFDYLGPNLRGAIPLSALVARGSNAFRFRSIIGLASAPAQVTDDGFTSDMDVYLHMVYPGDPCMSDDEHPLFIPPAWQVEDYEEVKTSGSLRHCERCTEYAAIRHQEEDGDGLSLAAYSNMNVQQHGLPTSQGLTLAQMTERTLMDVGSMMNGGFAEGFVNSNLDTSFALPALAGNLEVFMMADQQKAPKGEACGTISYKFDRTAAQPQTRYLQRTNHGHTQRRATMLREAACMPPNSKVVAIADNCGCKVQTPMNAGPSATLRVGPVTHVEVNAPGGSAQ